MKETADLGASRTRVELPAFALTEFRRTRAAIARQSAVVWGEHCTECAFPSCYSACSFYTPRSDHHCRRFVAGIEDISAGDLALTRIAFRRWGKLEGKGPAALLPPRRRALLEAADRIADRALSPLPLRLKDSLRWRWNTQKQKQAAAGPPPGAREVFVVEALCEADQPFTLSILPAQKSAQGLYQQALPMKAGYNRFVVPVAGIAAQVDLAADFLIQIEPISENGAGPVVFGVIDFCALSAPLPTTGGVTATSVRPKVKCVVWDLDNTLWRGTLVEDGIEGVSLRTDSLAAVAAFDERGIINSIASKNDPELAFAALEKFGIRDYFVFPQISWGPKSAAIRQIATAMDVGLDTFAFIDDQPFELGEIAQLVPEVEGFLDSAVPGLLAGPRFDVPATAESRNRRAMYQTEEKRQGALQSSDLDYGAFLRSCAIGLTVSRLSADNLTRIYELSQRTNQLNFSGVRYSRQELEALDPRDTFVLRCSDKFGDYGIIGFCVLEGREVASFFMSCRVQRKRVEEAFFSFLAAELAARGAGEMHIRYRATAKNGASVAMLEGLGFAYGDEGDGAGHFTRPVGPPFAEADVVALTVADPIVEVA